MRLDLTDEERRTLLRLVRDAIDASRFPCRLRSRHCAILPISCAARRSRRHRGASAPCCGLAFASTPPARRSRRRSGERVYAYKDEHPTERERYEIANAREHVMELQCSTFANVSSFCRELAKCGDKVGPNVSQIRGRSGARGLHGRAGCARYYHTPPRSVRMPRAFSADAILSSGAIPAT